MMETSERECYDTKRMQEATMALKRNESDAKSKKRERNQQELCDKRETRGHEREGGYWPSEDGSYEVSSEGSGPVPSEEA